jgi:hypothetical protein
LSLKIPNSKSNKKAMDKIIKEIKAEIEEQKRVVASCALSRMNSILLSMKFNHQLEEPHSMETIANWLEREMSEFKQDFMV